MKKFFNPKERKTIEINIDNNGIYDLFFSDKLSKITEEQKSYYDENAKIYDDVAHLSFDIQNENEDKIRNDFIKWLDLKENHIVLDLSC